MLQGLYTPSQFQSNDQNLYTIKYFTWWFFRYRNGQADQIFLTLPTLALHFRSVCAFLDHNTPRRILEGKAIRKWHLILIGKIPFCQKHSPN